MAKLDVMRDGCKPCSKGREFFSADIKPLVLSEGSQTLKGLPYNTWLFQLIEIYQSKRSFQNVAQVWSFRKIDNEVWALCEDLQGNVLTSLGNNIFESFSYFNDVTLCIADGKCVLKEEHFTSLEVLISA